MVLVFIFAVAVSLLGAVVQWGDSAHSIGLITAEGGRVRHPVTFAAGDRRSMLIATATVLPPYRGDVRLSLEGAPAIDYTVSASAPIIDLGIRRRPVLKDGVLSDLQPRDRLALFVELRPPRLDPVCRMAVGNDDAFCSPACEALFAADPEKYRGGELLEGSYNLAFNDLKTGRAVLKIPVRFGGREAQGDGGGHQH